MIPIYVGFDPREACVYHTFCQSVIEQSSELVSFTPLHQDMLHGFDGQQDGTNAFIFSRYLVPYLNGFSGAALFVDGDMHVNADITELLDLFDPEKAVQVVKHDYETQHPRKYIGTPIENDNIDYPRKNWSSVVLFNCSHPSNKILTPEFVSEAGGAFLHRFQWLTDDEIGELPKEWNWLEGEYPHNPYAKLVHQTLGSPGFEYYSNSCSSKDWNRYLLNALHMEGERQAEIVRRAHWWNSKREVKPIDINSKQRVSER
jgi:hypothetical protein